MFFENNYVTYHVVIIADKTSKSQVEEKLNVLVNSGFVEICEDEIKETEESADSQPPAKRQRTDSSKVYGVMVFASYLLVSWFPICYELLSDPYSFVLSLRYESYLFLQLVSKA